MVFFYLAALNGALSYELSAGPLFDVSDDSDYAQTLLGNLPGACIMTS
jgi:26S proteasome regulatory subunit N2